MKAVLLAGGFGTRLAEETDVRPKPMVEIGKMPILWHIMKTYSFYGVNEFIICTGYKGSYINDYFLNYAARKSNITIDLSGSEPEYIFKSKDVEPWKIHIVDTGLSSMTGGRIKRISELVKDDDFFHMTYGDGVCDIDINQLTNFHRSHNKLATVTATYPAARFGAINLDDENKVIGFHEKPEGDGNLINGGYFVLSPKVMDFILDDLTIWEKEPMNKLSELGELHAFVHRGFWRPMDTLRDKIYLTDLVETKKAPWIKW